MRKIRLLLYATVVASLLLAVGCMDYKEFDKIRIKPFNPAIVVPVAFTDSITLMDMIAGQEDMAQLDFSYPDGRVGFRYTGTVARVGRGLNKSIKELNFTGGKLKGSSVFEFSNAVPTKVTFEAGTTLKGDPSWKSDVSIPAMQGEKQLTVKLPTGGGDMEAPGLDAGEPYTLLFANGVLSSKVTGKISIATGAVMSAETSNIVMTSQSSHNIINSIGVYKGLLWYSGELTDPRVLLKINRKGWPLNATVRCWLDNYKIFTRRDGVKYATLVGSNAAGEVLPFNDSAKKERTLTLEAGKAYDSLEYFVGQTNLGRLTSDWAVDFKTGLIHYDVPGTVLIAREDVHNLVGAWVTLKLPVTGKFHALVKEFKVGGEKEEGVELPDLSTLFGDTSSRKNVNVRASLSDDDTVNLHFNFANAMPFEIYLGVKLGELDPKVVSKEGEELAMQRASEISKEDGSAIDGAKVDDNLTIGQFKFFKAVGSSGLERQDGGWSFAGGKTSNRVTVQVPYKQYEQVRTAGDPKQRRLRALLLLRGAKIEDQGVTVAPRLTDYVSVRLGLEVKPRVEIEMKNKE